MAVDAARAKSLFLAASDMPDSAARAAYLERECGSDAELWARVEALLRANDAAPLPSTEEANRTGAYVPNDPNQTEDYGDPTARVGAVLAGRYKLVEEIGEGGMGSVFMAQQTEPVKRAVAVKVIKAGMDSRAVLARLEAERQALAMMDHPNIAKVLDAGTTDGGRPFFVMELVKGTPITRYCDEHKLTPRQRLELFVPVCQAIQHAHQKGIIHRDIKPSNVLVALYDDKPVPKVIDFGVAKAAGQSLTDKTLMTGFGVLVGTPEYMSPEQASLNNLDIDTRSDVYALGVLLYELLTGTTTVDRKQLRNAAILEILRIVREVEAPRPSTKLSSSPALPVIAANRNTEPAKLSRLLKGELDWILLKALEKDRARRYESATSLAADVQRYLAGEPVQAVPPSAGYRLKKFVLRNKAAVAAVSLVLTAVLLGVIGIGIGMMNAERATLAERTRDLLADEKSQTEQARIAAEAARDALKLSQENLAHIEYGRTVQVAYQAWRGNNVAAALTFLESTRKDLRGWEWDYVHRLCHTELAVFKGTGGSWNADHARVLLVWEKRAKVWDAITGKEVFRFPTPVDARSSLSLSPDGTRLAATTGGKATLWDVNRGAGIATFKGMTQPVRFVSWSPDSARLLTLVDDAVTIWDSRSGARLHILHGHAKKVLGAAFSPDSSRIVTWSADRTATIWETRTGKELFTLAGNAESTFFSPDGSLVVTEASGTAKLWHATTGTEFVTNGVPLGGVSHLLFSPDGRRFAFAFGRGAHVLDARTGALLCALEDTPVSFNHDGTRVAVIVGPERVPTGVRGPQFFGYRICDTATGAELFKLKGHTHFVTSAVFSPDGKWILTTSHDRTARLWDAKTGDEWRILKGHTGWVMTGAFSRDGKRVVTESLERDVPEPDLTTRVWDLSRVPEGLTLRGHVQTIWSVAFRPDGARIATAGIADARTWDARTGASLLVVKTNIEGIASATWNPDGSRFVTGNGDGTAIVWDARSGARIVTLGVDSPEVHCTAWNKDGSRIALGRWTLFKGSAELWDPRTGKKVFDLAARGWVHSVAFSPDGARLAIATDQKIAQVFDVKTGAELLVLKGHTNTVSAVAFSPDGSRILTGSYDRTAKLWNARTGAEIRTLRGHTDQLMCAAWSPDGSRIVTGGYDQTAKIWDAKSGADLLTLVGHTNRIHSVSWSPDGWQIVTGCEDTTAKIWDARPLNAEFKPKAKARARLRTPREQ